MKQIPSIENQRIVSMFSTTMPQLLPVASIPCHFLIGVMIARTGLQGDYGSYHTTCVIIISDIYHGSPQSLHSENGTVHKVT